MLFTAEKQAKNEHDTATDIMRIIESFFVVMIHLSDFSSLSSIFSNSIAHFSVPVFVIISGYYILGNNQCGKTLIIKTLKLFLAMILCSFFHLTIDLIFETKIISSAIEILYFLFTEPGHLWYIYATMTLYLFTPLIAIFHNHTDKKTYLYALILTFFLALL